MSGTFEDVNINLYTCMYYMYLSVHVCKGFNPDLQVSMFQSRSSSIYVSIQIFKYLCFNPDLQVSMFQSRSSSIYVLSVLPLTCVGLCLTVY